MIAHNYEEIEYNKQNELFIVQKNDKQGVISQEGKEILKPEYDYIMLSGQTINAKKGESIYSFDKEGKVQQTENKMTILPTENSQYFIVIDEKDQFGIMDANKNKILENEYSYIEYTFGDYFIVTKDSKVGVIKASTKEEMISSDNVIQKVEGSNVLQLIIPEPYTIELYNEKMEKVASMKEANLNVEKDFIQLSSATERKYFDKNGNKIENTEIFPNLALFAFEQNGKWGYKNTKGTIVVDAIYDMATELNEYGFAGIKQNGKWGVINSKGEVIVEPSYELEWDEPEFIGPYYKLNFGYGMVYYTKQWQEE